MSQSRFVVLAFLAMGTVTGLAQSGRPFGSATFAPQLPVVEDTADDEELDVIVKFKDDAAPESRHSRRAGFARRFGLTARHDHELINSHAYRLRKADVDRLAADPDVEFVAPDREVRPTLDRARAAVMATTLTRRSFYTGSSSSIAIIDSGINVSSEAFSDGSISRVVYSKSFIPGVTSTADEYGHGTHVASIAAGDGIGTGLQAGQGKYSGLAAEADLLNLRVLDKNGVGKDSSVIAALAWVVLNKNYYNIRVVNLSLGRPVYSSYKLDPLCLAVEAAWKAGIVVVVAAGNEGRNNSGQNQGYGTITAPGNDPYVITVGAAKTGDTDSRVDDMPASYSSKGPSMIDHVVKPDLLAPGNRIVALGTGALWTSNPGNIVDATNKYMRLSGSSMAAPMVSGAVALLLESNGTLTPNQVKARLMKNAWRGFAPSATVVDNGQSYTVRGDIFSVGAGYLDIDAAVADWTYLPRASAQSPTAIYDTVTKKVKLIAGTNVIWGDSTSPLNVIWGTNIVAGTNVIWGDNVVWGDATAGSNVVWGDRSIFSATSDVSGEAAAVLIKGEN